MNEQRIKELLIEAVVNVGPDDRDRGAKEKTLHKFAELIVRECASICELNGASYKHSFTPAKARLAESTSIYCGELIKRHFGVEQ